MRTHLTGVEPLLRQFDKQVHVRASGPCAGHTGSLGHAHELAVRQHVASRPICVRVHLEKGGVIYCYRMLK